MECEVCGRQIIGKALNIVIDGAKLVVCSECAQLSTPASQSYREERAVVKKSAPAPRVRQQAVRTGETPIHDDLELVENYGSLVRKARENMGLTHDELSRKAGAKVSILQKLETGKMVPDLDLAKRLENTLKIKLLQPSSKVPVEERFSSKPSELTLGDVVSTKKKEEE
ncbi:MAG: multiprotein bridging factor aMBF1 [Candidatus Bathyarchaeota archaeon]